MAVFLPSAAFVVLIAAVIVWLLSHKPVYGLYVLLFLYPFLGWQIDFSAFEFTRALPWVSSVNAPLADLWAIMLLAAVGLYWIREYWAGRPIRFKLPGLLLFGLFVVSALLSLFNLELYDTIYGLKYLARNIVFVYVAYLVLPANILKRQEEIWRAIQWLLAAGAIAVLWGIASLFVLEPFWGMWRRVSPFAIGGWAPLGLYHNDLAEVLTALIPLALYWYYRERRDQWRKIAFLYCAVMIVVTLLTFSRTAWLVMFVQVGVFIALSKRREWREIVRSIVPFALVLVVPIAVYMLVFSSSAYVASSTSARMDLTRVATLALAEHPIVGNGVGSYISLVAQATAFRIEYGPPFDAHGVIQKLAAEQGVLGLTTFVVLIGWIIWMIYLAFEQEQSVQHKELLLALLVIMIGAIIYQMFNTQYYTAKMWVPIGFALAVSRLKINN